MAFLFDTTDDIEDAISGDTEAEQAVDGEGHHERGRLEDSGVVSREWPPVSRRGGVPLVACGGAF